MPEVSPPTQSTSKLRGRAPRRRYLRVGAWVGVIAFFLTTLVMGYRTVSDVLACTPVTQKELTAQEESVVDRVGDAYDVDATVMDCDDDGDGVISFKTHLTPADARDAFLTDTSCQPYNGDEQTDFAVSCPSGRLQVYVFLTASPTGGPTTGDLTIET